MNREERRRMVKKFPAYKKALRGGAKKAVDDLEKMFQKQWYDDEILNDGDIIDGGYDFEDEIYND